jgi:hypothetical protein
MEARQASLFPDGAEPWGRALDALEELDVAAARQRVAEAAEVALDRPELLEIEVAIQWLEAEGLEPGAPLERAVDAFRARARGRAPRSGASRGRAAADAALARHLLRRAAQGATFVGEHAPLPAGRLWLVLEAPTRALHSLQHAVGDWSGSDLRVEAEVWSALGDLYHLEGDEGAASAYARSLALDPTAMEPFRLRHAGLAELLRSLEAVHGEALARQYWLVEAWLHGLVDFADRSPWSATHPARWASLRSAVEDGTTAGRARLFTLLFVEDRTAATPTADLDRRLAMHDLEPRLLERVMATLRTRER